MRQTWEEIGLDLAEKHFLCVGQLDDREITTSLGKRLLRVLSVYLRLGPDEQPIVSPRDNPALDSARPAWGRDSTRRD